MSPRAADWAFIPARADSVNPFLLPATGAAVVAAIALFAVAFLRRRNGRRQRVMHQLLDAADALEERLRTARAEIEAVAGEHSEDPVHEAMREMLRQRLWLREQGQQASVGELQQVRRSIDEARARIEQQLVQIQRARAPAV